MDKEMEAKSGIRSRVNRWIQDRCDSVARQKADYRTYNAAVARLQSLGLLRSTPLRCNLTSSGSST